MKDLNEDSFGLLIAFLLPGFMLLWGLSFTSSVVASWLTTYSAEHAVAVGGFLYSTLASLALGLLISAVRWLIIDTVIGWLGIHGKGLNYGKLSDEHVLAAYRAIVANHYRYYQYYSNSLIALGTAFAVYVYQKIVLKHEAVQWYVYAVIIFLLIVLFSASYDTLKKMYDKMKPVLT
jgi:hypothetical protein